MNILLINGSPAENSSTGVLLKHLEGLFADKGCQTKFINLNELQLPYNNPLYHADATQSDVDKVRQFAADVAESSVVVLGTPLYHGSFSGMLKVALDNLDGDAFAGKKILLVSNGSKATGSLQAANELIIVARTMQGDVYLRTIGSCKSDYDEAGGHKVLASPDLLDRCQVIVDDLA